jgi:membrane-bound serine protease (ClpP class)
MFIRQRSGSRRVGAIGAMCALALVAWFAFAAQPEQSTGARAVMLEISDAIGPATSRFFVRTLERAEKDNARLIVLQMDTPGGLDSAMRDMIRAILGSSIPVVIYVAPSGARAASAGTYLLYASHVAAMAPATNLGAATPVQIGGSPSPAPAPKDSPSDEDKGKDAEQAPPQDGATASERKAINDAVAYIRGLAELRGRDVEWAEAAVRSAASLSASAALERKVIDVIATDIEDLLKQIDGRKVKVSTGEIEIDTDGVVVERVEADWRTNLLAVLTNPNVAYLLMMVGVYGLLLEGYNPGAILPGVTGAICLLLALFAFQVLSVNYAGLALIALGIALLIAEAFAPSFGVLGLGGVIAFVVGSIILMDTEVPGFQIARSLIIGIAGTGALLMLLTVMYFSRSRRRPVATGAEQLLEEPAFAMEDFEGSGLVRVHGEIWQAVSRVPVKKDQRLRVLHVDGLTLEVAPDNAKS